MYCYTSGKMTCLIKLKSPTLLITLKGSFDQNSDLLLDQINSDNSMPLSILLSKKFNGLIFDLSEVSITNNELEKFLLYCTLIWHSDEKNRTICGIFGESRNSLDFLRSFGYQNNIWSSRDVTGAELMCHADLVRCTIKTPCRDYVLGDIYVFDLAQGPSTIYVERAGPDAGLFGRTTVLQPAELLYYFSPIVL